MTTAVPRVVFVAGGTSGINFAVAQHYAALGCRVAVLSRSQDKVDAAVHALADSGADAIGFAADVRDAQAVDDAFARAAQAWGPIDVLVSGAAGNFAAPASELSPRGFETVVDIDLVGTFNVMRAAWGRLSTPGAAIVNVTAAQSWLPIPGQIHVNAAKAGIDQVTRTLAVEWGPNGIRVNSVAPGPVSGTEGMRRLAPTESSVKAWTQAVPLRRFAETDDVVRAIDWLCSDAASYVTGQVLSVDGGLALGGAGAIASAITA
ncbi:SDR family oxidoreductase [Gordonia sp. (in: high G+C Gram-positive bacteria)]|uniref:SDR family oxidoreductase n=1 Tax=Gordonia sp. (in: high G+C Gram-positive bacteria) TaxID=84139 RepID=UPI003F9BD8B4